MLKQPTVLIVEADRLIRESLVVRLCRAGYSVTELTHPRQALAATSLRSYDVAIVAQELPEIDGISLMDQLNRRGGIGRFVIITYEGSELDATGTIDRGAFAIVPSYRVASELEETVERAIESLCSETDSDLDSKSLNESVEAAAANT